MAKLKDEFRRNNSKDGRGHPAYIFEEAGDEYKFVGITHSEYTKGIKNISLDSNPNPKDKRKAYMTSKSDKKKKSSFGKKIKGWKMSSSDKKKIK